ncbi:hypothetical protein BWD12_01375 [Leptospira santarosai serovar Bananal]|nr:hypothetical protein BWD11_16920 [Leptospira santarosai serovar Grippotyphosa]ONF81586.1 hypothetical protein BWD12_01375 [Leptospira santarosai serovar Bananal]ONF86262.1 hypothetical protein BWD13_10720 [Leptospira santarosai serovar Grippotyphosa]
MWELPREFNNNTMRPKAINPKRRNLWELLHVENLYKNSKLTILKIKFLHEIAILRSIAK